MTHVPHEKIIEFEIMDMYLKGIAWDHPRGYEPLRALSDDFNKLYPQVNIKWDVRSLKEFGDMPIEDLIEEYDLVTIDHPYMGQAHKNQLLVNFKDYISTEDLKMYKDRYVGPCFSSYEYENNLFAMPIDAAALVAAKREDLFLELGISVPTTQNELENFYRKIPSEYIVAWPLCAVDIWCSFLTLCAQEGGRNFIQNYTIDSDIGALAIDQLKFHLDFLHPASIHWNPIQILDHMTEKDEIIYAPFLFGYTNYSRKGYAKKEVVFLDSPVNPKNDVSTILGGVGLAVSSKSNQKEAAVKFAEYTASPKIQKSSYFIHQGQPASVSAWKDEQNNARCNNFFNNTLKTMQRAYVRPRHLLWNEFQEKGSVLLHANIQKNRTSDVIIKELNELYKSIVSYA